MKNNDGSSAMFEETERLDKEMVERWLGETDSVIIFATLFSAVGAVSLVESYKWLSLQSGDQTVSLLNATVNLLAQEINSNKAGVESIVAAGDPPFHRTAEMVAVNILWFGSMVICIGCAIIATLIQQWGRRYLALTARGHESASDRELVQEFLYKGMIKFRMHWVRQAVSMLLHSSVFLYCLGIIVFIIHIDWTLAPLAAGYLCFCFVLYAIATVLPFFFLDCPFSTPFTPLAWRVYHFSIFWLFLSLCLTFLLFFWTPSWQALYNKAKKHLTRSWEGQKRSVADYVKALNPNYSPPV